MIQWDVRLDAKGLACPMPIVKTKKAMNDLQEGQILQVQATDRGSIADIAAWAENVGHQYIGTHEEEDVLYHYLRKCNNDYVEENLFEHVINNDDLMEKVDQGGILLDVREQAEYAFGHIPGAIHISLGDLEARHHELAQDQPIYVICRTGKRSDLAAQKLVKLGHQQVFNVIPGMQRWQGKLRKEL